MQLTNYREWQERFDKRMTIRRRVMELLGIVLPKQIRAETQEAIRQSMIGCATCEFTQSCEKWVNQNDTGAGPPSFCPNRDALLRLMAVKA